MNIIQSLFSRAMLAVALVTGAGAAVAGPLYHVDLDLSKFSGLGALDIQFNPSGKIFPAKATLTNFSDNFTLAATKWGSVEGSVLEGQITFDNTDMPELLQVVNLGYHLGFDISFDSPDSGLGGSDFYIGLFDANGTTALIDQLLLVNFNSRGMQVDASPYASFGPATPAAVPEPSAALLVMLGLLMATAVLRRRA